MTFEEKLMNKIKNDKKMIENNKYEIYHLLTIDIELIMIIRKTTIMQKEKKEIISISRYELIKLEIEFLEIINQ